MLNSNTCNHLTVYKQMIYIYLIIMSVRLDYLKPSNFEKTNKF